jgi:hypothetical protein
MVNICKFLLTLLPYVGDRPALIFYGPNDKSVIRVTSHWLRMSFIPNNLFLLVLMRRDHQKYHKLRRLGSG